MDKHIPVKCPKVRYTVQVCSHVGVVVVSLLYGGKAAVRRLGTSHTYGIQHFHRILCLYVVMVIKMATRKGVAPSLSTAQSRDCQHSIAARY